LVWSLPPREPVLAAGRIQLWRLAPPAAVGDQDWSLLSAEERERAARLSLVELRARYVADRAALRRILGAYLQQDPVSLIIVAGPKGKPHLAPPAHGLHFNLSHSGPLSLLALSPDLELGLDLERLMPRAQLPAIARRMFGAEPARQLESLPEPERCRGFYAYWTRMEAQVKAVGGALYQTGADWPRELPVPASHWFIPAEGYLACLAAVGACPESDCWQAFYDLPRIG
jgi:4'-phosphopantetheinyl transferase